jgi:hypothetical protein
MRKKLKIGVGKLNNGANRGLFPNYSRQMAVPCIGACLVRGRKMDVVFPDWQKRKKIG